MPSRKCGSRTAIELLTVTSGGLANSASDRNCLATTFAGWAEELTGRDRGSAAPGCGGERGAVVAGSEPDEVRLAGGGLGPALGGEGEQVLQSSALRRSPGQQSLSHPVNHASAQQRRYGGQANPEVVQGTLRALGLAHCLQVDHSLVARRCSPWNPIEHQLYACWDGPKYLQRRM